MAANSVIKWIDQTFDYCVQLVFYVAVILKNSFEEINVWLFYFIWSLLSLIRLIKIFRLRMKINFIFD